MSARVASAGLRRALLGLLLALAWNGCAPRLPAPRPRAEAISAQAVKVTPGEDVHPPVVHEAGWSPPTPLGAPINTAGAEDSPFVTPDGQRLFFFFTPDVRISAQQQVGDGVSGIWVAKRIPGGWAEPERLLLGRGPALDGCPTYRHGELWFCSARTGNWREVDIYLATYRDGRVGRVRSAGRRLNAEIGVGEFHLNADGHMLAFHAALPNGYGGLDLWRVERQGRTWGEPVNLGPDVNSPRDETRPFVTSDGSALWYSGDSRLGFPGHALYRSLRGSDGQWGRAEEIVSSFAAEPTLDDAGVLCFVHHFVNQEGLAEADIYSMQRTESQP